MGMWVSGSGCGRGRQPTPEHINRHEDATEAKHRLVKRWRISVNQSEEELEKTSLQIWQNRSLAKDSVSCRRRWVSQWKSEDCSVKNKGWISDKQESPASVMCYNCGQMSQFGTNSLTISRERIQSLDLLADQDGNDHHLSLWHSCN